MRPDCACEMRPPPAHAVLTAALFELRCHTKLSRSATVRLLCQTANFSPKLENRHFDKATLWLRRLPFSDQVGAIEREISLRAGDVTLGL